MRPTRYTVYRLLDDADRLLYVGVTSNWHQRRALHRSQSPWYPQVARVIIEEFDTADEACDREFALVTELDPVHNKRRHRGHAGSWDMPMDTPTVEMDLRLAPELMTALDVWAQEEERSLHGQIAYILRRATAEHDEQKKRDKVERRRAGGV